MKTSRAILLSWELNKMLTLLLKKSRLSLPRFLARFMYRISHFVIGKPTPNFFGIWRSLLGSFTKSSRYHEVPWFFLNNPPNYRLDSKILILKNKEISHMMLISKITAISMDLTLMLETTWVVWWAKLLMEDPVSVELPIITTNFIVYTS